MRRAEETRGFSCAPRHEAGRAPPASSTTPVPAGFTQHTLVFPALSPGSVCLGRYLGSLPGRSAPGRCLRVCPHPTLAPTRPLWFGINVGEDVSWVAGRAGAAPDGLPTPPEPGMVNYGPPARAGSFHLPRLMPVSLPGAGAGSPCPVQGLPCARGSAAAACPSVKCPAEQPTCSVSLVFWLCSERSLVPAAMPRAAAVGLPSGILVSCLVPVASFHERFCFFTADFSCLAPFGL